MSDDFGRSTTLNVNVVIPPLTGAQSPAPPTTTTSPTASVPTPPPPAPTTYTETVGGLAHTWTDYSNAGGTEGPSIASNRPFRSPARSPVSRSPTETPGGTGSPRAPGTTSTTFQPTPSTTMVRPREASLAPPSSTRPWRTAEPQARAHRRQSAQHPHHPRVRPSPKRNRSITRSTRSRTITTPPEKAHRSVPA